MNLSFWKKEKPETLVDKKYRLAAELSALSDEDAREVVRFARKGQHLARNSKKKREVKGNEALAEGK